jgi:DNA-binding NarL/FixJ family response regulator
LERARILLADDHPELLAIAERMISSDPSLEVVETFTNGQTVVDRAAGLNPDAAVLDITMPGLNGIEVARELVKLEVPVVFLTVHDDPDYLRTALATGAIGYVVKDRLATDLLPALRDALVGRQFVSHSSALDGAMGAFK